METSAERAGREEGAPSIGVSLAEAVAAVRERLGDEAAPVAVLTPSTVNGALAAQSLGASTPFIRVSFLTPAQLHQGLAGPSLRAAGLRPPPPGWTRATLGRLLRGGELGPYGEVMQRPGWRAALTAAVEALEAGGVSGPVLRRLQGGDLEARAALLAALIEGLEAARAEEGIAGPRALAEAALAAVREGRPIPFNVPKGAVILGDARNSRAVAETLAAWLAEREVARIGLAPLEALGPAWGGARAARPDAAVIACEAPAPIVRMVRTPDPVREQAEIVRRVLAGVRQGLALDRIAVVLPDPSEAVALREALGRASLPATWMTGPPLASTPAARFLLHALAIARGEDTVASWYELLARPGLRLTRALGPGATRGRGRWRRILARSGAYRGTATLLRALDAASESAAEEHAARDEAPRDEVDGLADPDAERAAIASLRRGVAHFAERFAGWRTPRPLGGWMTEWRGFVRRHWRDTPETSALLALLEAFGRADAGPPLGLAEAAEALDDALRTSPRTAGSLADASVRVLSPMQCLGGDFDLICVASMTQGRFPLNPSEDPILSDALIDAIEQHVDAGLFRSQDRMALERRRLAAVRAAARGELWLSCPRVDMMKGRPLLPGTLLLELVEALEGQRPGFDALEARLEPVGRRSRPHPRDPAAALDRREHLVARLLEGDDAERGAALRALADHPVAARLMRAYRAADLIRQGRREPGLRAHAGFVPPEVLRCQGLDGAPLAPGALKDLLADPASFLVRRMLGAWPAPRLREDFDPVAGWHLRARLAEQADALLLESAEALADELVPRFEAALDEVLGRAGMDEPTTRQRALRLGARMAQALLAVEPGAGPRLALASAEVARGLPWRLEGASGRRVGASLEWLVKSAPKPKGQAEGYAFLAELAAARARGERIDELRWVGVDGSESAPKGGFEPLLEGFEARLALVTELVSAGAFPGAGPSRLKLDAHPESAVDEEWWATWRS